ncbi:AI-2E family transporter [Listeria ivanovii]|uniref:Putative membrane protein n=1 Tax=Listeria ivanovii (strain ATCC BAA-678 / PAM 55) TaxID=881621 RepID=G2ZDR3_LISIP|nr:AI-2E family transporter [Listeria ivanovii]AHI55406.1 membrane protein [Listeria ivanovii WSLC3009]AIS64865.1 membrane protein [Listeria ivanovii subsp. ivanovii]MBC1758423.1 AI-2E family transporter [Listeria ivanovii]MBK3913299.1 AI-2E family transporter [Listeria ivanovii subsp. ivanovii]MBK3920584.1 AI-2E family transporter [Listeria ivanovii subsp. ivanovii]
MKLSRFRDSKLFFWTIEILAVVAVIFILLQMKYIFSPIGIIISTLFMPILVAGFLFYLFNPLVLFLEKRKVPRILSVIIIFIAFIGLIVLAVMQLGPTLAEQVTGLAKAIPGYWQDFEKWLQGISKNSSLQGVDLKAELEKLNISLPKIMSVVVDGVASSFGAIISFVSGFVMILVTVPFIVFYMFKDGHKFVESSGKFFPAAIRTEAKQIIKEMNKTISTYISSQAIDCLVVGLFTFIGYLIIGQPYALLFGLIAGATNIIPYLGPFIGAAPAVIVALFTSPLQALLVIIVVTIVQQLDSNLLSPYIMGKSLSIHPLTIIIILIVAGNLAGIFGMILGVPVYAVVKTIIMNVNRLIKLRRGELALENNPPDPPAPKA